MSPADLAGRRFRLASPRTALALGILFAVVALALVPLSLLLSIDSGFYAVISYPLGHHLPLGPAALFLYELWGPALSLFALVVLVFPDGTLPARSSRAIMGLFVAVLVGFTAALGVAVADVVATHQVVLDSFDGLAVIDHATGAHGQPDRNRAAGS